MKPLFYFSLILALFSCSEDQPTIDGTDQIGFNQSVERVKEKLPALQKNKFTEAIQLLYQFKTSVNNENRWEILRQELNEKTADEIFTLTENAAASHNISWNRNQAPNPNGLNLTPNNEKKEANKDKVAVESPIKDATSVEIDLALEKNTIIIYPTILREDGTIIRFAETIGNVLVEISSNNKLVKSMKGKLETYRDSSPVYGGDGIPIALSSLDKKKIYTEKLSVKIRVPHPENYLTQTKFISIPTEYIGHKEEQSNKNDSVKIPKQDIDEVVTKSIVNRFLQNIKAKHLNRAFALTKNPKWNSLKVFSDKENGFGQINDMNIGTISFVGKQENQAILKVNYSTKNVRKINTDYAFEYILTKENQKWFITDSKLLERIETPNKIKEEEPDSINITSDDDKDF